MIAVPTQRSVSSETGCWTTGMLMSWSNPVPLEKYTGHEEMSLFTELIQVRIVLLSED